MARDFFPTNKDEMKGCTNHFHLIIIILVVDKKVNMSISFCSLLINCSPQGDYVLPLSVQKAIVLSSNCKSRTVQNSNGTCLLAFLGNLSSKLHIA